MKIVIQGTEYDVTDAVNRATLNDLMQLKVKTRKDGYPGVSAKTIKAAFEHMAERFKDATADGEEFDGVELLDDDEFMLNMVGVMWLARRRAGENLTVDEAGNVSFLDFQFIGDDDTDDEDEEEGETPFSGAADAAPQTTPTSTTSTT